MQSRKLYLNIIYLGNMKNDLKVYKKCCKKQPKNIDKKTLKLYNLITFN